MKCKKCSNCLLLPLGMKGHIPNLKTLYMFKRSYNSLKKVNREMLKPIAKICPICGMVYNIDLSEG